MTDRSLLARRARDLESFILVADERDLDAISLALRAVERCIEEATRMRSPGTLEKLDRRRGRR